MSKQKSAPGSEIVSVRFLSDWGGHLCGQYAELPANLARQLVEQGLADDTKASVDYARYLRTVGA